jgi:general secretion pathway protein M
MMAQLAAAWRDRPWLRRAAFVAGNFTAALMIAALVVAPVQGFFAERAAQIASQRTLLARFAAMAAQQTRVEAAAREAEGQTEQGEFLVGTNEGVIVADLQTRLKTMAEAAGARLRSVQSLPAKTREDVRYVGARLDVFGPIAAIQRTLHAVEAGAPYLFVDAAVVRAAPSVNPAALANAAAQEPVIDAQIDVFGPVHLKGREP